MEYSCPACIVWTFPLYLEDTFTWSSAIRVSIVSLKPDDSCGFTPTRAQNAFQKALVNCGPRSDVTSRGSPCSRKTCWTRIWAVSLADGSFGSGTKCADLEKRSTMDRMMVLPWDLGNPVTKSTAMWDHGALAMAEVAPGDVGSYLWP